MSLNLFHKAFTSINARELIINNFLPRRYLKQCGKSANPYTFFQNLKENPAGNGWHSFFIMIIKIKMNNWLRTLIAGYAGWRWGGGCFGFILVFVIVYFLLGHVHC
jgi:hypothetical protein